MVRPQSNKQWRLKERPEGPIQESHFELKEVPIEGLKEGEVLVKNQYFSIDPTQRTWMQQDSYLPAVPLGEVMRSFAAGAVIESKDPDFKEGDRVSGLFGWQEYAVVHPKRGFSFQRIPEKTSYEDCLNVCGLNGLTAYFGLLRIGEPKQGETVLVSAAAGATGSIAAQIAKVKGCRAIGITGTDDKSKWLKEELKLDGVINYKTQNVREKIKQLCPNGVDVYFDNVGGDMLDAALENLAKFGRVVLCGAISEYNKDPKNIKGPPHYINLLFKSGKMQGFIVGNFEKEYPEAMKELAKWAQEGSIITKEDIQEGFENLPATLIRLFEGKNIGKQLLKV